MIASALSALSIGLFSCSWCGSVFRKTDLLCLKCAARIGKKLKLYEEVLSVENEANQMTTPVSHLAPSMPYIAVPVSYRYLVNWIPGESDFLSRYIHLLKGDCQDLEWHFVAKAALDLGIGDWFCETKAKLLFLVPIPGRPGRGHAKLFANAISALTGIAVLDCLIPEVRADSQKDLSREERARTQFVVNTSSTTVNFTNTNLRLIIIDDVLTTASTVKAAIKSLQLTGIRSQQIRVLSFAKRSDSCEF